MIEKLYFRVSEIARKYEVSPYNIRKQIEALNVPLDNGKVFNKFIPQIVKPYIKMTHKEALAYQEYYETTECILTEIREDDFGHFSVWELISGKKLKS